MAEETSKLTAKDRLDKVDSILDEYEGKLGLPPYKKEFPQQEKIKEWLELTRDTLERLTPDQCLEVAYILISFCGHLQRSKNRDKARISWADSQLRLSATPRINQYRGGSFTQNFDMAVLDDAYSSKVLQIKDFAQQRADRLEFLSNNIKDRAELLKEIARNKRSNNG